MIPGYSTTEAAARLLGVRRNRIVTLIRDEVLPAERIGRDYLIKNEDLELHKATARRPGRPRKMTEEETKKEPRLA